MKELVESRGPTFIGDLAGYYEKRRGARAEPTVMDSFLRQGFRSLVRYPVFREERLVVSLSLSSTTLDAFNEHHCKLLQALPIDSALIHALHYEEQAEGGFRFRLLNEMTNCHSNKALSHLIVQHISDHYQWAHVSLFEIDEHAKSIRLMSPCG